MAPRRSGRKIKQNTTNIDVEGLLNDINIIGINILVEEIKTLLPILEKYAKAEKQDKIATFTLRISKDILFDGFTLKDFQSNNFNGKLSYTANSNKYFMRVLGEIKDADKNQNQNFGDWLENIILPKDQEGIRKLIRTYENKLDFEELDIDFNDQEATNIEEILEKLPNLVHLNYEDIFDAFLIGPIKGILLDGILTPISKMDYELTDQEKKKKIHIGYL